MSKKAIVFALSAILLASSVGGAFGPAVAQAADNAWSLYCTPNVQSAQSGQWMSFTAGYSYGSPAGQLTWTAVGGSPATGTGTTFGTQFYTSSINETRIVSVTDGVQTTSCTVYVYGGQYFTPTPTPWQGSLYCNPSFTYATSGQTTYFTAGGGNGTYAWYTLEGTPSSGVGQSFATQWYNYGTYAQARTVTVTSGSQTATCNVSVYGSYVTPTPTPYNASPVTFNHTIRNLTRGGEGASVNAYNGDRLQFVATVTTGNGYAYDVRLRDWLPQYVSYVSGTTTLDGAWQSDDIVRGNSNTSLGLATLAPNRTYTIRFEGTLNSAPNGSLTNSMNVHVQGYVDQSRTATIWVTGSYITPTPTPTTIVTQPGLTMTGRDLTRGQSNEYTTVRARGGDTVDFFIRVRPQDNQHLTNVWVTNYLPAGLNYIGGSTTLNGVAVADGVTTSGLYVGQLSSGQTATVKFSARVDAGSVPSVGQVTVINRAQARADNTTVLAAQMNVVLGQNLASIAGVQTGPADALWLALLVAALTTGLYAAYTRTALFGRRMALTEIRTLAGRGMNFSR